MDDQTISAKCRRIRQHLTDLLATLDHGPAQTTMTTTTTVTASSIKDVLERFMLWAGNLGALRKPTSKLSLDSRLLSSPDLLDYICTELDAMAEAVGDLMNLVNGTQPDREVDYGSGFENDFDMQSDGSSCSNDSFDEAASVLEVVSQTITSLLKVGILVRQPASSGTDRFHRAFRDSTSAFLDRFDIDYVQHKHPKLGTGDQSSRLGSAIARRRQFIRYCRDHKSNLAAEEKEVKHLPGPQIGSQKATTAKQSSKAATFIAKENLMNILQGSADAVSHCSVSTTSESLAILKLPRLAELLPDDYPFECPICYTLQQFRSEQAWRRHAYRDLKAYVCTVGGTECNDKFFDDRTSWFTHELENHRSKYACVLCGDRDGHALRQRNELKQHILHVHGKFDPDQLELLEDAGRNTVIEFKADDCPFCDDWSALLAKQMPPGRDTRPGHNFTVSAYRFKKHVAMHLEQLAIFALPRHQYEDGPDGDGSHGSDSRVADSRSSGSLLGSFGSQGDQVIQAQQDDDNTPSWHDQVNQAIDSRLRPEPTPTTAPSNPPASPGDLNAPCTLYVGNLPTDSSEAELLAVFSTMGGYKRHMYRAKHHGPLCYVEFENFYFAKKAIDQLDGYALSNVRQGGLQLRFAKNPLAVPTSQASEQNDVPTDTAPNLPPTESLWNENLQLPSTSEEAPDKSMATTPAVDDNKEEDPEGVDEKSARGSQDFNWEHNPAMETRHKPEIRTPELLNRLDYVHKRSNQLQEDLGQLTAGQGPETDAESANLDNSATNQFLSRGLPRFKEHWEALDSLETRMDIDLEQPRSVIQSAVVTEDDRKLVESVKQLGRSGFVHMAMSDPRNRDPVYWVKRWHEITAASNDSPDTQEQVESQEEDDKVETIPRLDQNTPEGHGLKEQIENHSDTNKDKGKDKGKLEASGDEANAYIDTAAHITEDVEGEDAIDGVHTENPDSVQQLAEEASLDRVPSDALSGVESKQGSSQTILDSADESLPGVLERGSSQGEPWLKAEKPKRAPGKIRRFFSSPFLKKRARKLVDMEAKAIKRQPKDEEARPSTIIEREEPMQADKAQGDDDNTGPGNIAKGKDEGSTSISKHSVTPQSIGDLGDLSDQGDQERTNVIPQASTSAASDSDDMYAHMGGGTLGYPPSRDSKASSPTGSFYERAVINNSLVTPPDAARYSSSVNSPEATENDQSISKHQEDELMVYESQELDLAIKSLPLGVKSTEVVEEGDEEDGTSWVQTEGEGHSSSTMPAIRGYCPDCPRIFSKLSDLERHRKTHTRPFKCPYSSCKYADRGWPTEKELERHMSDKHSPQTITYYACVYEGCNYESKRESNAVQHMEKTHVAKNTSGNELAPQRIRPRRVVRQPETPPNDGAAVNNGIN